MPDPLDDRLMLMIDEGKNFREMAEEIGKSLDVTHGRVQKLVDEGYVYQELEKGQARPYRITEAGKAYLSVNGFRPIKLFED